MDRDEFMELVYETFADEPDNVLANGIIEAADAYAEHEKTQLSCEGTTKDAISRQWLLECIKEGWIKFDTDKDANRFIHLVRDIAPSVQPERTCVNCGRTVNNGGWYADGGTRCPIEEHYALPKGGYCHLWEKRNVTDDDYPERQEK